MDAPVLDAEYTDASDSDSLIVYAPLALDTEGYKERPWGLSFSCEPRTGHVCRADSPGLAAFIRLVPAADLVVLHNALHDLPVLRALGVQLREGQYTDTMIKAYLLGEDFVGLKKLAGKYLGKEREGYMDVMEVASERIARAWLQEIVSTFPRFPGPKPPDIEKKLRLIDRMLKKYDDELVLYGGDVKQAHFYEPKFKGLRKRWNDCVAREFFEDETGLVEPMPEATLDDIPLADAVQYAGEDADDTLRLNPILDKKIEALGLQDVLATDLGIIPMIDRMQTVGLKTDPQYFRDLSLLFQIEMDNILAEITELAGKPVNPRSGDQVAEWLFTDLGLQNRKKTDTGRPTTDDKTLQALLKNPRTSEKGKRAIDLICEYREVSKLKTSYADVIPGFIGPDRRLHPHFKLTATGTGRLAAEKPNLLAFPKHSARGKLIRGGFYADEGHSLGEWDLDQIEMRVMAIDAEDVQMITEFLSGVDKHTSTASMIFAKPIDQVDKEIERFAAKAVNFGILMGITEFGLLDQFKKNGSFRGKETVYNKITEEWEERRIEWTEAECKKLLDDWHRAYPQASSYQYGKHAEARRYGFVRDMWGRCRWLPDIESDNPYFRAEAERQAQATPIQSGAQGIVKRWMIAVWKRLPSLWNQGIYVEPLLQIHDALILEFDTEAYDAVNQMMLDALSELQLFVIPITCKGKAGSRWSDL
jgi:DNA polymerase I-like protein with 3'-5' exonuclease and polymerase domains